MNRSRREFLKNAAWAGAAAMAGGCGTAASRPLFCRRLPEPEFMWAYFAQFGVKMWESRKHFSDLKFDVSMWNSLTDRAAETGVNVIPIDLGEGMLFPSHPELAVRGSWEPERMKEEIARLKKMGIMLVPKLNFSSSHDQWLGKWRNYLSTPEYFAVCRDVLADVAEVFDESPLFHIGYDEEIFAIQNINKFEYKRLRSGNVWWNDFMWFVKEVESHGMRPWIWSDGFWDHTEEFISRMPRSVLQSNWYYEKEFDVAKLKARRKRMVECYSEIDKAGFEQVPCGSTYMCRDNFLTTVAHCRKVIRPNRLKGFFMAAWYGPTQEKRRDRIMSSFEVMAEAMKLWKNG